MRSTTAPVAQRIERLPSKQLVVGSIPTGGTTVNRATPTPAEGPRAAEATPVTVGRGVTVAAIVRN
jgi:hypothetical protein